MNKGIALIVGVGIAGVAAGIQTYRNIKKQEIMYAAIKDAVDDIQRKKEPARQETIDALLQKCQGNSYEIVVEDFPGQARFDYDAEKQTFSVSLGLSDEGAQACGRYENGSCTAYKSDFAPSKWVYIDDGIDGYVDRIKGYRQYRDGREEQMTNEPFSLNEDAVLFALMEGIREYRRGVDAAEAELPFYEAVGEADVVKIITMKKEGLLDVQKNAYAAQLDFFSNIDPEHPGVLVTQFECL